MRRSIGLVLLAACVEGCAALSAWDGFSGTKETDLVPEDSADTGTKRSVVDAGRDARADPVVVAGGDENPPRAPITLVQSSLASKEGSKLNAFGTVVSTTAQQAGSLNVVIIGWYDAAIDATGVTDSSGNHYVPAGTRALEGPPSAVSQRMFFAPNIKAAAAGANTITVTFDGAADSPDLRVYEFAGLDEATPLDQTSASTGGGSGPTTGTSGPVSTTFARALVVGGITTQGLASAGGSGFISLLSQQRNIAEYRIVDAKGTYALTASIVGENSASDDEWVAQVATFR